MKKIKGYVMCESTKRLLNRFKILWLDESQEENQLSFGSETEGFFEIKLPSEIQQIFIIKENYERTVINLLPNFNSYIAKIRKN